MLTGRRGDSGPLPWWSARWPAVVSLVATLMLAGITVKLVAVHASACAGDIPLRIAATPEIAPVLTYVGEEWMATEPRIGLRCIRLRVEAVDAPAVASVLTASSGSPIDVAAATPSTSPPPPTGLTPSTGPASPTGPTSSTSAAGTASPAGTAGPPDVWVPDSTTWLVRVRSVDRNGFAAQPRSLATSPIVLAMPEHAARSIGWPQRGLALDAVRQLLSATGAFRLGLAEPRRETASLVATVLVGQTFATGENELPTLVKALRGVTRTSSTGELLRELGREVTVAPASEQAVIAFAATGTQVPVVSVPFQGATPQLDYPYAIRASLPRDQALAAEQFRSALLAPAAASRLARAGFRGPDGRIGTGFPTQTTANPAAYYGVSLVDARVVARALGLWTTANSPVRTLALLDVTSSTGRYLAPAGTSRLRVMTSAVTGGLDLFAADSRVGLWTFRSGALPPERVLAVEALTGTRKASLEAALSRLRPRPGDKPQLYEAVLAAYRFMLDGYDASRPNVIVVLTDGGDADRGALALARFTEAVQDLADPVRPVGVVVVGVGVAAGSADEENVSAIASVVGGRFGALADPDEFEMIFLTALLRLGGTELPGGR